MLRGALILQIQAEINEEERKLFSEKQASLMGTVKINLFILASFILCF